MEINKENFLNKFKEYSPNGDITLIELAYDFALEKHEGQKRLSGEPYFVHCYNVAYTLLEYRLDAVIVAAALLHDVIEDTNMTPEELSDMFGDKISKLVEGVTKIDSFDFSVSDTATAENWRKMLMATAQDVRVVLIKLADRLHNMRTIEFQKPEKRVKKAKETLTLYAPLAQRLGIFKLKSELEDLSFAVLEPETYQELTAKLEGEEQKRKTSLEKFTSEIDAKLADTGIPFRILARAKNIYSFYRKMKAQNRTVDEIQDSLGVRIITDSVANCYAILGFVHSIFKPVSGSFTDYIAIPKMNLYQSLHTTVVSPYNGDLVEIQIRTEEMHRNSEYGIAAHWRYKLGEIKDEHYDEKLNWFRQWIEWLQDLTSPREFLESFQTDMELQQVFVFTPKGEVKALPMGANVLDFAYAVHTDVGARCVGAKVNGKIVTLDHKLVSGDFCEILTRKNGKPSPGWLKIVTTARARSKIRKYLNEHGLNDNF